MKRILSLLLIVTMIVALTGCSKNTVNSKKGNPLDGNWESIKTEQHNEKTYRYEVYVTFNNNGTGTSTEKDYENNVLIDNVESEFMWSSYESNIIIEFKDESPRKITYSIKENTLIITTSLGSILTFTKI